MSTATGNELIERYIYAVIRRLPQKIRSDVQKELDSLISDMLEARCKDMPPTEKDVRVVLTELGSPEEMAAKYGEKEKNALISGMYYQAYRQILIIVLPIVALAVPFALAISGLVNWQPQDTYAVIPSLIGEAIGSTVIAVALAFSIITIVFKVLEQKQVDFGNYDYLETLPQVPKTSARIKVSESVAGIVWAVVVAAIFLACPEIIGLWSEGSGWVPVFNTEIIRSMWYLIAFWTVIQIIRESIAVVDGSYTKRLAIVTTGANILVGAAMVIFFSNTQLMNPKFVEWVPQLIHGENVDFLVRVLQNMNVAFIVVVLIALLAGIVASIYKAWKYARE